MRSFCLRGYDHREGRRICRLRRMSLDRAPKDWLSHALRMLGNPVSVIGSPSGMKDTVLSKDGRTLLNR